ncbi:RNA polymerase sigma-70 factor [Chondrinema litorale]|uniref:RNA polymerase sigma-70 factor n=1 Tax=Chondrinema litorale TaxID=2994555 RepID=UPI0025429D66|nr:RNA polymerase sigma-70 factor [Chondrinema litorale]UZR92954.1 RNA polymerase sigma-70 factor [Chondrinema litorale]
MQQSNHKYDFEEDEILNQLRKDNQKVFEHLFRNKYEELYAFSVKITRQPEASEELVQDIFVYLWEKRKELEVKTNLKTYLYSAVKNRSIDYLRSKYVKMQSAFIDDDNLTQSNLVTASNELQEKELAEIIKKGIAQLPEKCRIIFLMSREGALSYQEIADQLGVSHNTVKAQVAIALQKMRSFIEAHWGKIISLIISLL